MRFWLLDAIEEVEPDQRLLAVKNVSYSEEYLQDHFPEFPVLPGVFMLEAATQAAAWLLRLTDNYADTVIALKEAKNIKYADFVPPGRQLRVEVTQTKKEPGTASFKVQGTIGEKNSLTGRIELERFSLADRDPELAETDARMRSYFRKWESAILRPGVFAADLAAPATPNPA
ncbi:MAG: 3-hydroxyacyl-ACP dehydratase FabZ family protein [Planctomycetota bacterium]